MNNDNNVGLILSIVALVLSIIAVSINISYYVSESDGDAVNTAIHAVEQAAIALSDSAWNVDDGTIVFHTVASQQPYRTMPDSIWFNNDGTVTYNAVNDSGRACYITVTKDEWLRMQ